MESCQLIQQMLDILEEIEGKFHYKSQLEKFGQLVDRIMGGAKSIALTLEEPGNLVVIGDYAELCKAIGYKGAQIGNNPALYDLVVAFLFDATEMLRDLTESLGTDNEMDLVSSFSEPLKGRLGWILEQFGEDVRGTLALDHDEEKDSEQELSEATTAEIEALIAKIGLK